MAAQPAGSWTVTVASGPREEAAAAAVEAQVFAEWFGNTAEQLADEYAPYRDASVLLAAREHADGPILAVGRLLRPSPAGLKTLVDVTAAPWEADADALAEAAGLDLARTWDVASVAALPPARGRHASLALYAALVDTMIRSGATWWTAIVDAKVFALLRSAGVAVEPLPGLDAAPYLGSPASIPVYGLLAPTARRLAAAH